MKKRVPTVEKSIKIRIKLGNLRNRKEAVPVESDKRREKQYMRSEGLTGSRACGKNLGFIPSAVKRQ